MTTLNQELFDRQVQHLLQTKRYQEAVALSLEKTGKRHRGFLEKLFRKELKVTEAVTAEVKRYGEELLSVGRSSIEDYLGAELDFQVNTLRTATNGWATLSSPNRSELARAITSSPLKLHNTGKSHGTVTEAFSAITSSELTRLQATIRKGIAKGDSPDVLIKELMLKSKLTEHQAKTIVNTNFSQAESLVKEKVAASNAALVKGLVFTAILDSRTSKTCSLYDGLLQAPDKVKVRPPLHWNCRSTLVPVLRGKRELSESLSTAVNKEALAAIDDATLSGLVPEKEGFSSWLLRQPMELKLKYLGSEEKVALLERGALNLSDFYSGKGQPIELGVLRAKDNLLTYFWPFGSSEKASVAKLTTVSRPYHLVRSEKLQKELADLLVQDSTNASQPLSLVDYKGTTLAGKRGVRRATNNEFDPRNNSFDPYTGEISSNYYYDPDFTLYRERIDYMKESKLLDTKQKATIEAIAESLEDRLSVNQRTAVVENLRIVFERYQKDLVPWEDFSTVLRAEMNFSVTNTSRLLDRRSRARAQLFLGFRGDAKEPSVMIQGDVVPIATLHDEKLKYERYTRTWRTKEGEDLARSMYYSLNAPWKTYFLPTTKKVSGLEASIKDSLIKRSIRSLFYKDDPIGFYTRYGKTPEKWTKLVKKYYSKKLEFKWIEFLKEVNEEGLIDFVTRTIREEYRYLVDLQWLYTRKTSLLSKALEPLEGRSVAVLAKLLEVVAEGITTDYDSLAISLGRTMKQSWPDFVPYLGSSLQDYHKEGSQILDYLREQKIIRLNSRGVTRRAVVDLDTGRAGGNWKDTVSREVEILDPSMLRLQDYNRRIELSNRMGVERPANRYYVVPGKKSYLDARGEDSGVSLVTRSAAANFDEKTIDGDVADMLNHTMSFDYEVDPEFASFMDELVRFKDPRGKTAYYDDLNLFREEIIRRGDQGYGLMETIRYYLATGKTFRAHARIDGRGRVYYNGGLNSR